MFFIFIFAPNYESQLNHTISINDVTFVEKLPSIVQFFARYTIIIGAQFSILLLFMRNI